MSGGYPCRKKYKPMTSNLTVGEHAELARIAATHGIAPTAYATRILRAAIADPAREETQTTACTQRK